MPASRPAEWQAEGVLRTFRPPATLRAEDLDVARRLVASDPIANVFVGARMAAAGSYATQNIIAMTEGPTLRSMCWTSANVVPIGVHESELDGYAARLRRHRRRSSSVFGLAIQVLPLWERLEKHWGRPRSVRHAQPLMAATVDDLNDAVGADPRVRPAVLDELDLVVPAAAHMFTGEIGYPPYYGSDREYRRMVAALIRQGHTYVIVEGGRVIFKADIGSLAFGVAQIQGVWVEPALRGHGIAAPAMKAVAQQVLTDHAGTVSLYVNDFNTAAIRTYDRVGFKQYDTFATVIL